MIVGNPERSDHATISFNVKTAEPSKVTARIGWCYSKKHYYNLRSELDINWDQLLAGKTAQQIWWRKQ